MSVAGESVLSEIDPDDNFFNFNAHGLNLPYLTLAEFNQTLINEPKFTTILDPHRF